MGDGNNTDTEKSIEKLDLVECDICGYHYHKTKKCPQCSMRGKQGEDNWRGQHSH